MSGEQAMRMSALESPFCYGLERADDALGPAFWGLVALALAATLAFSIIMQLGTDEPFR
jgi:hypothetical protein